MHIIGFAGPAGAGKSTAASDLHWHRDYKVMSFAAPLKRMLSALSPRWREYGKEDPNPELSGRSARYALQTLGTEWGREHMHPEFWCDQAMLEVNRWGADRIVFDDVRFQNEVDTINGTGGQVYILAGRSYDLAANIAAHKSEDHDALDGVIEISNRGTLEELRDKVLALAPLP